MVRRAVHQETLDKLRRTERELAMLRAERQAPVQPPAAALRPYDLCFPIDRDHWVSVRSNKPLQPKHWNRLERILEMQRETLCELDVSFGPLIPDDAGVA